MGTIITPTRICYLGIDPGVNGAFALICPQGEVVRVEAFQKRAGKLDVHLLFDQLFTFAREGKMKAILEQVSGRGGPEARWSATGVFSFGKTVGWLEMALVSLHVPYTYVAPQRWQKVMHQGVQTNVGAKQRSEIAAKRIFLRETFLPSERSKKPHDGIIDALLMAEYGRRQNL